MSRTKTTARPIQQLLDRLENVRPSGSGWTALCPSHDDNRASLSVAEGRDGLALIHCFAGCETQEIVKALGLEMSDLFPRKQTTIPRKEVKRHGPDA